MSSSRKKVCLILCGGTALSPKRPRATSVLKEGDIPGWLDKMPEINIMAEIDPLFISSGEDIEANPQLWKLFTREITKRFNKYDGFIITHEINTISYTAAALSFMLQNLSKPVVLTGSQISIKNKLSPKVFSSLFKGYGNLGIKANLTNAMQIATQNIAEVCVMFANKLIRGSRIYKTNFAVLNIFESFGLKSLGEADFSVKIFEHHFKRKELKLKAYPRLNDKVQLIELHPNLSPQNLSQAIKNKEGLILKVYDSGILSPDLKSYLQKISQIIPVIIHTSLKYEQKFKKVNFMVINNLTIESTLAKLMWLLTQTKNIEKIKKMMCINYVGELN